MNKQEILREAQIRKAANEVYKEKHEEWVAKKKIEMNYVFFFLVGIIIGMVFATI